MKLSYAFKMFANARLGEGYSQNTINIYEWVFRELVTFLGDPEIEAITKLDLSNFMGHMRLNYRTFKGTKLSASSLDNCWKGIRSFFGWAQRDLDLQRPDTTLPRPKDGSVREIVPFTDLEIDRLLDACLLTREYDIAGRRRFKTARPSALRDRAMVAFLLDSGVRVGEFCRLAIEDINLETGEVRVEKYGTGMKTHGRTVFIGRNARSLLMRYLATRKNSREDDPLFVTGKDNPFDPSTVAHLLRRLGERAGVENVHPHRFRHTFATIFLQNGGGIENLQRLLGHRSLAMALVYAKISDGDVMNAHQRASPFDRKKIRR